MILIIGKGFIGSELFASFAKVDHTPCSLMSHDENWETVIRRERPQLVVNAAAMTGQKKCNEASWDAVEEANVKLPMKITDTALAVGSKCLLFSTTSVYSQPHSTPKDEECSRYPSNSYVESKIEMENAVESTDVVVFRVPSVIGSGYYPSDFLNRIRTWQKVQWCYISLLYIDTLCCAVAHIARHKVRGIFNISNFDFACLPKFVKSYYKELPIWEDSQIPADFTQGHLADTTKARVAGILCERK